MNAPAPASPPTAQPLQPAPAPISQPLTFRELMDEKLSKLLAACVAGMGAIGLFSYFFHIEYFPTLGLTSFAGLLVLAGYVMLMMLIPMSLVFLSPYAAIMLFFRDGAALLTPEQRAKKSIIWAGISTLCLMLMAAVPTLLYEASGRVEYAILLQFIILAFAKLAVDYRVVKQPSSSWGAGSVLRRLKGKFFSQFLEFLLLAFMQAMPLMLLTILLSGSIKPDAGPQEFLVPVASYCIASALIGGAMLYVALSPNMRAPVILAMIVTLLFTPLVVSILVEAPGAIPMTIARLGKIGNFTAVRLSIAPTSCGDLAAVTPIQCDVESKKPFQICNVHVLSRVGNETYLWLPGRVTEGNNKDGRRRIMLPTSEIRMWQVDESKRFTSIHALSDDLAKRSSQCAPPT